MGAPPTPTLAPTVYSIALCPDYAPGCGSGNAPSASVGDTCTTECKEHGNAWFCFVGNSDVKWGWCAQQQVCTAIDSIATDAWCMSSCNHIPSHCPASHCKCTATTAAPPTAAPSTAVPAPTPPSPNCLSWCAVNAKPWSEKCAWGASCNECDDCATSAPPTPAPPCIAISSTATDAWCTSTCNHIPPNCPASHCQCTATTAAPPTAAPSVPTPTPPSPNCLSWCAVNANLGQRNVLGVQAATNVTIAQDQHHLRQHRRQSLTRTANLGAPRIRDHGRRNANGHLLARVLTARNRLIACCQDASIGIR